MVRRRALRHCLELDVGCAFLVSELTGLPHHHAAVDPPHLTVLLAILLRLELEDGDAGLFAVSGGEPEVFHCGFLAAVWAGADVAPGTHLGW